VSGTRIHPTPGPVRTNEAAVRNIISTIYRNVLVEVCYEPRNQEPTRLRPLA